MTSVPLCFNGISSCFFGGMGFPWVFLFLESFPKAFGWIFQEEHKVALGASIFLGLVQTVVGPLFGKQIVVVADFGHSPTFQNDDAIGFA